jgi:hypothetical protein
MKAGDLENLKMVINQYDICYVAEVNKFRLLRKGATDYMYLTPIAFFRYFSTVYGIDPDTWFSILNDMNRMRLTTEFEIDIKLTDSQIAIGMGE